MDFTYTDYKVLLNSLKINNYNYTDYFDYREFEKSVILRHDVDYSLDKALVMAELEHRMGFQATYFILISSDFYNIFSNRSLNYIKCIINLGHHIGLHFDETKYECRSDNDLINYIIAEINLMTEMIGEEVKVVSMHRPSKALLSKNLIIPNIINSYSDTFFKQMKYISDSRMNWREDPFKVINTNEYDNLHILTHPFWYSDKIESRKEKVLNFIEQAKIERQSILKENITNLNEIIEEF